MDSESPLPAKRMRGSLNGNNLQLTECIREFKLPRQFPSMVTKLNADTNVEKRLRPSYQSTVGILQKTCYSTKVIHNKNNLVSNAMRKIKLKGTDGRDLGEVNVQDLPQNIQGKTICLSKNGIRKPEILPVTDKAQGITIGVLTPVNVVKADRSIICPTDNKIIQSLTCVTNIDNNQLSDVGEDSDSRRYSVEKKNMTSPKDSQGRPQVLVFQSGKNWHMVKIASNTPPTRVPTSQNKKNIIVGKWPQSLSKVNIAANANQGSSIVVSTQNRVDISSTAAMKISNSQPRNMVVGRWSVSRKPGRCKSKSPTALETVETSKPKIEISRVFVPTSGNSNFQIQTKLPKENGKSAAANGDSSAQKNINLRQDIMVVLPTESSASLDNESSNGSTDLCKKDSSTTSSNITGSAWRKKYLTNKNGEGSKYSAARDLSSAKKPETKSSVNGEKTNENMHLSILEKALSTVEDGDLRVKAFKALAECGIGLERFVPVRPSCEQKPVKDSDTQTPVFGLWDPVEFIYVPKDSPGIERKRPIERQQPQNVAHIVGNTHSQDLTLNGVQMPIPDGPGRVLNDLVGRFVDGNDNATLVQNMLTKKNLHPVRTEVIEQLEEDFQSCKQYDQEGLLNIHKAVLANQPRAVLRQIKVLKAFQDSVDLPTIDGQTSLELAVQCEVSPMIVKMLLENGAQPTCEEAAHDSALIIASKRSLPILMDLIPCVTLTKSLDNYDSSGFAALHHCAQNGNEAGVKALIRASANIDLPDRRSGRTALFHAVENEHMDLAQMLLDSGAKASITNYSGQTVANLVDDSRHYSFAETLNRLAK